MLLLLLSMLLPTRVFAQASIPNTEIVLGISYDGTAPFVPDPTFAANTDGQHTPGADENGNNFVVRTFDIVQYRIDWNVNEVDGTNVVLTSVLPTANELEWVIDPQIPLPPGCKDSGVTPVSSISADGKTLICNLGDQPEGTSGTIYPNALVGKHLDNETFTINSTIETDQSPAVTSNDIELTISAAPKWNWKKDESPDIYVGVDYNGDPGQVVVWPIYLVGGSGGDARGIEEMNDAVPIQFFDHMYAWTADVSAPFTGTLITTANVGNLNNYNGRVCGGYTGSGSFPYGVTILGTSDATNTTQGVQDGTETITCAELPAASTTAGYPIVQIDIAGHNTKTIADRKADGTANGGIAVAAQIAFFIPDSELFPLGSGNGYIHNAISGDTNTIAPPNFATPETVTTVPVGSSIQVAGTSGSVNESKTDDNLIANQLEYGVIGGGGGGGVKRLQHWVAFDPGPIQLREMPVNSSPSYGLTFLGLDHRAPSAGGLGYNHLGPNGALGLGYTYEGEVARGQDFTLSYDLYSSDGTKPGLPVSHEEELHGCIYFDNTWIEMTELPGSLNVGVTTNENGSVTTGGYTISPSHPQAHVIYGDKGYQVGSRERDGIRVNPSFQPNYVLEFAQAATTVGTYYDRHEVTCRQDNAADIVGNDGVGDWIDATDPNFDTIFGKTTDGRYPTIEMVRLRTLEPVPWRSPSENSTTKNRGAAFEILLNVRVKTTIPNPIDGTHKIYAHASRATGPWDGIGDPPTPHCWGFFNLPSTGPNTNANPPNGVCNKATVPVSAGGVDPLERSGGRFVAHRDLATVVSSRPTIKKKNLAGLQDMVDNGDLVTYTLDVGVVGADIIPDSVTNIVVTDTIPAYYEFVDFVGTQSTQLNNETSASPGAAVATPHCSYDGVSKQVLCNFGDQVGGWSDTITMTLKVVNATANQALPNTAEIDATNRLTNAKTSVAFAYMIPDRHEHEIRHEVEDLNGDCTRPPGVTAHVVGDCSVTDIDGQMSFTINYTNTGNMDMENVYVINALPHINDAAEPQTTFQGTPASSGDLGDGRTPPSVFSGSISLVSATDSNGFPIEHTVDAIATVDRNPATNGNTWVAGTVPTATGLRMIIPKMTPGMTGTMTIVYDTLGNVNDDIYTSNFGSQALGSQPISSLAFASAVSADAAVNAAAAAFATAGGEGAIYVGNRSNDVSAMVYSPLRIGNRVWFDANDNGVIDGESGIDGVTVELLDNNGTVISTTTTANGGFYLFQSDSNGDLLNNSDYQVRIPASNFGPNQPLQYLRSSSVDGGDPDNNTDSDDNGPSAGSGNITSDPISLTNNSEPSNDGDDSDGNLTVDFGFYLPPAELSVQKSLIVPASDAAGVGDAVSYELRIENTGQMTVTELVLNDFYDTSYLQFSGASITPDLISSGVLTWTGTTTGGSLQSALPLVPSGVVTVTVDFVAIEP